ncbi:MAG TPA: sialidase family protein [Actinomycetota bacterium]
MLVGALTGILAVGIPPAGARPSRMRVMVYDTRFETYEPSMGVTRPGGIFFDGFAGPGSILPAVIGSTDGGRTWKVKFDHHLNSNDPYLYVDPATSRIFSSDLTPPCEQLSFSDDNGRTWTTAPPAGCIWNEDHETIFAGPAPRGGLKPAGYPNVVYLCSIGGGLSVASTMSTCSKSLDGGLLFVPTGEPAFFDNPRYRGDFGLPGLCQGATGHGFVGPDGTVYLPKGYCGQPFVAISRNEGLTWTRVQVADNGMNCCTGLVGGQHDPTDHFFDHESGVAADGHGNVYFDWVAADRQPYLAVSHDEGATWSRPIRIASPGIREAVLPGMAIRPDGTIAMIYLASRNSPWDGTKATGPYTQAVTWDAYIVVSSNVAASHPRFTTVRIGSDLDPLIRGSCGPVTCPGMGEFIDVEFGPDGTVWASVEDECHGHKCGFSDALIGHVTSGPLP